MKELTDCSIVIVDYGMGNLASVQNAFRRLGTEVSISDQTSIVKNADALILPGVGAFAEAMKNLHATGMHKALEDAVGVAKKPILGICLGMQILFESSTERGISTGLGLLRGKVEKMLVPADLHLPHVGWNEIHLCREKQLFPGIEKAATFYFDHSYHVICDDSLVTSRCQYGTEINASIKRDNIIATQFHPEKSQNAGLRVLRGFLNFVCEHYA